jgi:hypothetical protein
MPRAARRPGRRAPGRIVGVVALAGAALVIWMASRMGRRVQGAGGERLGPGAAVTRGDSLHTRGRGRLPLYLAPARGPVIDSARVGVLAARLVAGSEGGSAPVVALVRRDSVAGLALVGRLVVVPGEPGLLLFGAPGRRP